MLETQKHLDIKIMEVMSSKEADLFLKYTNVILN